MPNELDSSAGNQQEVRVSCFVFQDSGSGIRYSGFRIQASGFVLRASNFGFRVSGFGFEVSGFEFWDSGFEFRVSGSGVRIPDSGFLVTGFGFRGWNLSKDKVSRGPLRLAAFAQRCEHLCSRSEISSLFQVSGFVSGPGFQVSGFGFRVPALACMLSRTGFRWDAVDFEYRALMPNASGRGFRAANFGHLVRTTTSQQYEAVSRRARI